MVLWQISYLGFNRFLAKSDNESVKKENKTKQKMVKRYYCNNFIGGLLVRRRTLVRSNLQ